MLFSKATNLKPSNHSGNSTRAYAHRELESNHEWNKRPIVVLGLHRRSECAEAFEFFFQLKTWRQREMWLPMSGCGTHIIWSSAWLAQSKTHRQSLRDPSSECGIKSSQESRDKVDEQNVSLEWDSKRDHRATKSCRSGGSHLNKKKKKNPKSCRSGENTKCSSK